MSACLTSGHAIDFILAVVAAEVVILLRRRTFALADVAGQLLAGVMLLLALRCALTGAPVEWTALFLTASGPAHLFDLVRRAGQRANATTTAAKMKPNEIR